MEELFDLTKFDSYKEDNCREVKKALGRLPNNLQDTYLAFVNCYGGVIILGVKEDKEGKWHTTGLRDNDVETYSMDDTDDVIMIIWVPSARREQKPVYINDN